MFRKKTSDISTFPYVFVKHGLNKDKLRSYMDYMIITNSILSEWDRHLSNISVSRDADTLGC